MGSKMNTQQDRNAHKDLLNTIVAETLLRHADFNEKDYLKEIGFGETEIEESKAVNIAMFNVMVELTKKVLELQQKMKDLTEYFDITINDKGIIEGRNTNE